VTDPLTDLEDAQDQRDIGVFALRIYRGARTEGATRVEAFTVLVAWFRALLMHSAEAAE
jgi:hypothetical protein